MTRLEDIETAVKGGDFQMAELHHLSYTKEFLKSSTFLIAKGAHGNTSFYPDLGNLAGNITTLGGLIARKERKNALQTIVVIRAEVDEAKKLANEIIRSADQLK